MSNSKFHIQDNFIPEGLEFREEYMHAALSGYRRQKRSILWKRVSVAAAILLISAGSLWLVNRENSETQNTQASQSEQPAQTLKGSNDSLSKIDLVHDEGKLNKHRRSPAVESSEATRDPSSKAVDKGDPMSSGVGLPGQLSTSKGKIITSSNKINRRVQKALENEGINGTSTQKNINYQVSNHTIDENQEVEDEFQPILIASIPFELFQFDRTLEQHRPLSELSFSKWNVYATIGAKLWADYGFGSGPAKLDPIMGLGVDFKWKKKISLRANGQFFTVAGVAAPYVSTQRAHAEGFRETTYSYHTDKFYHAGISAGAVYRFSNKHSAGMLFDSNLLITAENRIETVNASSFEARTFSEVSARGYVQGFRKIQYSIGLSYEYSLGKNKSIGMAYIFSLLLLVARRPKWKSRSIGSPGLNNLQRFGLPQFLCCKFGHRIGYYFIPQLNQLGIRPRDYLHHIFDCRTILYQSFWSLFRSAETQWRQRRNGACRYRNSNQKQNNRRFSA